MRFDLHTHHNRCGHARGELRDYVEAALGSGLQFIGLSDHTPRFASPADQPLPGVAMAASEFSSYLAEAQRLRNEYRGRIEILIGVESDFYPEHVGLYGRVLRASELDYVIGSVHSLNGSDVFQPERWMELDENQMRSDKEAFCELVAASARSKLFDILGHIDVIKANCPEMDAIHTPAVESMVRTIAEADVAIEINTSGTTKKCGGWYPSIEIIELAHYYGVPFTFGSDAHDPFRVGESFDAVREVLDHLGVSQWYVFRDRQRLAVPIYE